VSRRDQVTENFRNIPLQKRFSPTNLGVQKLDLKVVAALEPLPAQGNDGEKQVATGLPLV